MRSARELRASSPGLRAQHGAYKLLPLGSALSFLAIGFIVLPGACLRKLVLVANGTQSSANRSRGRFVLCCAFQKFSSEVLRASNETTLDSCACLALPIPRRESQQRAAVSREHVPGITLADDWSDARRSHSRVCWCARPAKCFLCRSGEWRRLENRRFGAHLDADLRRSAFASCRSDRRRTFRPEHYLRIQRRRSGASRSSRR